MPRTAAALLSALAIVVGGCGSGDPADDTLPVPTSRPREDTDARLDPDDIVITDDDGTTTDRPAGTVITEDPTDDEDPTEDGADDGTTTGETVAAGDGAGGGTDPASSPATDGSGQDPTTGRDDVGFTTAEEIPDDWPDDVPSPSGLTEIAATVFEDSIEYTIVVTGTPSGDPTAYVDGYLAAARAAGFETTSVIEDTSQIYSFVAERDGWFLSAASTSVGGVDEIVVALTRNR